MKRVDPRGAHRVWSPVARCKDEAACRGRARACAIAAADTGQKQLVHTVRVQCHATFFHGIGKCQAALRQTS